MTPLTEAQRKKMDELAEAQCERITSTLVDADTRKRHFVNGFIAGIQHRDEPSEVGEFDSDAALDAEDDYARRSNDAFKVDFSKHFRHPFHDGARWQHSQDAAKIAKLQHELAQVITNGKNAVECLQGALVASQEREKVLREALKQVQKHGLHHYEDCKNREYDDQLCSCGMEKAETAILKALEKMSEVNDV